MVNIEFENGAVANIVSCCAMEGFGRVHLEVFCRGLVVTVGGSDTINRKGTEEPLSGDGGQDRDRVFIDAVKTGDASKILSPYSDALQTLRIMLAAEHLFRDRQGCRFVEIERRNRVFQSTGGGPPPPRFLWNQNMVKPKNM